MAHGRDKYWRGGTVTCIKEESKKKTGFPSIQQLVHCPPPFPDRCVHSVTIRAFLTNPRGVQPPGAGKRLLGGSQPLAGLDPPPGVGWGRLRKGPGDNAPHKTPRWVKNRGKAVISAEQPPATEETEWVSASVQSDGRWTYIHTEPFEASRQPVWKYHMNSVIVSSTHHKVKMTVLTFFALYISAYIFS